MAKLKPFEVIKTDHHEVICDGGKPPLGHPRIYMHINHHSGEAMCPYCSRLFVLNPDAPASVVH